jgi:hypothetical protein
MSDKTRYVLDTNVIISALLFKNSNSAKVVRAVSGKLSKGSQGLEIVDAGIQIFEKKPKLSPAESGGAET